MDKSLRQFEREWHQSRDPEIALRLLRLLDLSEAELLRHELFEDQSVRGAYAAGLPSEAPLRALIETQLALENQELSVEERSLRTLREASLLECHCATWLSPEARIGCWQASSDSPIEVGFSPVLAAKDRWEIRAGRSWRLPFRVDARDLLARGTAALGPQPLGRILLTGLYERRPVVIPQFLEPGEQPKWKIRAAKRKEDEFKLWERQREAYVERTYGPRELAPELAQGPVLRALEDLELDSSELGSEHTREFLSSPYLTNLRKLRLVARYQDSLAFTPLLERAPLRTITELHFTQVGDLDGRSSIDSRFIDRLWQCPVLENLKQLSIPSAKLEVADVLKLLRSPTLKSLTHLDFSLNKLSENQFEQIVTEPGLARVKSLDLSVTSSALAQSSILGSKFLREIESLSIAFPSFKTPELALHMAAELPELRHLDLSGWSFSRKSLSELGRRTLYPKLRSLVLFFSSLTDDEFSEMIQSPIFRSIENLDLRQTDIGDLGLNSLAKSPWGPRLRQIHLGTSSALAPSSFDGLLQLLQSQHSLTLNTLDLRGYEGESVGPLVQSLLSIPKPERLTRVLISDPDEATRLRELWGTGVMSPVIWPHRCQDA